jgi:hypothetical protein
MANTIRISKKPAEFDAYMNVTDELQKSVLTPPSTLRYTLYGWTQEESEQWTNFRLQSNILYAILSDPDKIGPAAETNMKLHIKTVRAYDNDKINGHHLLNKVADRGTMNDWQTFNVKEGTPREADPVEHADEPVKKPNVMLKENSVGSHLLRLYDPESPDSRKVPEGMMFAKLYRYIGTNPPENIHLYEFVGNAKQGYVSSEFSDYVPPDPNSKLYAWYFGRYESKKGPLGANGLILKVDVMIASA